MLVLHAAPGAVPFGVLGTIVWTGVVLLVYLYLLTEPNAINSSL